MIGTLLETFQIHQRINLYLLQAFEPADLSLKAAGKGRSIGETFGHMHQVRLLWLKEQQMPGFQNIPVLTKEDMQQKDKLSEALTASALAIEELLRQGFEKGKIKGFKPHPAAFLGYLISHESHHRGQIQLCAKLSGKSLDKELQFGLWDWAKR